MTIHDYSTGELPGPDEPQWDTVTLSRDFKVLSFGAPYALVERRSDGKRGTLQFNHEPRVYWDFQPTP
jgi:hypothetical protein